MHLPRREMRLVIRLTLSQGFCMAVQELLGQAVLKGAERGVWCIRERGGRRRQWSGKMTTSTGGDGKEVEASFLQ